MHYPAKLLEFIATKLGKKEHTLDFHTVKGAERKLAQQVTTMGAIRTLPPHPSCAVLRWCALVDVAPLLCAVSVAGSGQAQDDLRAPFRHGLQVLWAR